MRFVSAAAVALLAATPALAQEVTVFAAASLQTALDEIAAQWEAQSGEDVTLTYAGTPQLAQQIEQGAPADVFISAAVNWMDELEVEDLIVPESRRNLLGNSLVLVAHGEVAPVTIDSGLDLVGLLNGGKLAMALVDSVPAGVYGKEALTSLGLWESMEPFLAEAENVRSALALVSTGEVPLGIVYASDAVASEAAGEDTSVVGTFPEESHAPIIYPAALVAGHENRGAGFLDFLSSEDARTVFEAEGFTVLESSEG